MQNQLSRRQALKTILAASGGVAAASFLPAKWMRPLVLSGVLPVHAASSAKLGVKGAQNHQDPTIVFATVSTNPSHDFSYAPGKTSLAVTGGHAKHATHLKSWLPEYPAADIPVTLYWSADLLGTRIKWNEGTNPKYTDERGVTGDWEDMDEYGPGYAHFVIDGDEHSLELIGL
jgi:hypothetical protein